VFVCHGDSLKDPLGIGGAVAPIGLDGLQGADWHGKFASASFAGHLAIFFDLGIFLAINLAKAQDDELTEFCFDDLVDAEHFFLLKRPFAKSLGHDAIV
jgi:hypothetical protein